MIKFNMILTFLIFGLFIGTTFVSSTSISDYIYESYINEIDLNEPPRNPYLANSSWAESHRNSYCQASSSYPGPINTNNLQYNHLTVNLDIPITLTFSENYPDGKWVIWGSTTGFLGQIFKLDPETFTFIDRYIPQLEEGTSLQTSPSITGAYNILDCDGNFFVPNPNHCGIDSYIDENPGVRTSPIKLKARFIVPDDKLFRPDEEEILGLTMTYDGMIAFITNLGTVGIISRDLTTESAYYFSLNHEENDKVEEISNSIAADEDGGIYIVSDQLMYRLQWTGNNLTLNPSEGAWTAEYELGDGQHGGRLGIGSGSTPSLMGTGEQDKFVVITDGQDLMHLVLFWRDELPEDWESIGPGKDIRIAAEIPVTFGDINAEISYSEQSVLVQDYNALVVNNRLDWNILKYLPSKLQPFAMVFSNKKGIAPYGLEKFTWNPETKKLTSSWANPDISFPNGIPTMSTETGLIYCIGQRNELWTLEAVDWITGESSFYYEMTNSKRENSFYAATEIGPDNCIYTGTIFGISQFRPSE